MDKITDISEADKVTLSAFLNGSHIVPLDRVFSENTDFQNVYVCGRIVAKRSMGKVCFADLFSGGVRLQLIVKKGEAADAFHQLMQTHIGTFICAYGRKGMSNSGTPSVFVIKMLLLCTSEQKLPDKYHGIKDQQTLRRQRYLGVIGSPEAARIFILRSQIIQSFRDALLARDYLEIDTPILSTEPCASKARQFVAHHNDLDRPVYMRVSVELLMKQYLIAGYERIFEFCRCFRNEGTDGFHRQEFLNLEIYSAYTSTGTMKDLLIDLLERAVVIFLGKPVLTYQGRPHSLRNIPEIHVRNLILERTGLDISQDISEEEIRHKVASFLSLDESDVEDLDKQECVKRLIRSMVKHDSFYFLKGYPADFYPLTKVDEHNTGYADMQYLMFGNLDIAQICGEETDAVREQLMLRRQAEKSKKKVSADKDFLGALEYGMPPASGVGISMERIIMLMTNSESMYESNFFHLR